MFILMLLFFVFSIIIGTTYSYYVPNIIGNSSSDSLSMSNKNIEINYVNGSNILIDSTHTSVTKHITIKNNSDSVDYLLNFFDITNVLEDKTKLTYSYTCLGTGCLERSDIEAPSVEEPLTPLVSIDSGITHTYEITFTYDGTPSGSFTGKISCLKPIIYGASFNNASIGTRTNDAVGLSFTKNASTIDSDFDNADIYKEMTDVTDSYGNAFIKIPRFYIRKTKSGANIWTYQISKTKIIGYYLPECFKRQSTGEILDYVLVGKYIATLNVDKLESKTLVAPLGNTNIIAFRDYAKANGPSYQLSDIHIIDAIQVLFYIEFATLDSQSIMRGFSPSLTIYGSPVINGSTDSVATASGSPTNNSTGAYCMKYRGIENLYGNIFHLIDGINMQNNQAYVAKNPDNYASDVFDGEYVPIAYNCITNSNWVLEMGYDSDHPYINLPIDALSGDGSYLGSPAPVNSYFKAYYVSGTGVNKMSYGGIWSRNAQRAGIAYWNSESPSSDTHVRLGSRLVKKAF